MYNDRGLVYLMQKRFYSVSSLPNIKPVNLDEEAKYLLEFENFKFEERGLTLMSYGINLPANYQGCGEGHINLTDVSTVLIKLQKI